MSPVRVGVVPASPVLVPAVGGEQPDLVPVREAVLACCAWVVGAAPRSVLVVATTDEAAEWPGGSRWDLHGFGVAGAAARGSGAGPDLPWPLGIGAVWLDAVGWAGPRAYRGIDHPVPLDMNGNDAVLLVGDGGVTASETAMPEEAERQVRRRLLHALASADGPGLLAVSEPCPAVTPGSGWAGWASLGGVAQRAARVGARQVGDTIVDGVHVLTGGWELLIP